LSRPAEFDDRALERLDRAEGELLKSGRHLDTWMKLERERAARWLALERELAIRLELAARSEAEQLVQKPSTDLVHLLGPRPEEATTERVEWEALVEELQRSRLAGQFGEDLDLDDPKSLDQRAQLMERIERFREARELTSLNVAAALERVPELVGRGH
jgi:hypothetical protein